MRVEVEVSDEEAAYLRKHVHVHEAISLTTDGRVLARLTASLPRPIEVGDAVRFKRDNSYWYVVRALVDGGALLASTHNEEGYPCLGMWNAASVAQLERVRPVGALPGKAEQ